MTPLTKTIQEAEGKQFNDLVDLHEVNNVSWLGTIGDYRDFLNQAIQRTVEKTAEEMQKLIMDEILIANKEGQPTSRLTSLSLKISKGLTHSPKEEKA